MKKILLTILLVCTSCALYAASSAIIKGKVVDATTQQPIDYADVIVSDLNDKVVASGMVVDGAFTVENVPVFMISLNTAKKVLRKGQKYSLTANSYWSMKIFLKAYRLFCS